MRRKRVVWSEAIYAGLGFGLGVVCSVLFGWLEWLASNRRKRELDDARYEAHKQGMALGIKYRTGGKSCRAEGRARRGEGKAKAGSS